MPTEKVIIVGAGLAGSLLAIYLAKRGIAVDVFESRSDMRKETVAAGRSINLALSDRGIAALREVGMDEYMLAEAAPMYGRMIHTPTGETKLLPYSGREGEFINSVSRAGLNIALINESEKHDGVTFHFDQPCTDFDCKTGIAEFSNKPVVANTVIAADGAGSVIRQAMERQVPGFEVSSVFLEHGYKELHIPPGPGGSFQLEKNALHIWPRHQFMMIALPNFDGSFTCTLFLAHEGKNSFAELISPEDVQNFFEREFNDAVPLLPSLTEDFFGNPTGQLGTVKCFPWNVGGKALLLGDAAHALVPFYGQGMNCAFEDVSVLDSLVGELKGDWESVYTKYSELRKVNTDAIADMAQENFYEMRDATADPVFQRKRALETRLEHMFPDYFSKYSMVTFREDLPYRVAQRLGNAQDAFLMAICGDEAALESMESAEIYSRLQREVHGIG